MTENNNNTSIIITDFQTQDALEIIALLKENNQYGSEAIEGIDAMIVSTQYPSHLFFVAKYQGELAGIIRGTHEGYRTMIHLLSVKPTLQGLGIGKQLVEHFRQVTQSRGGTSLSVTAAPEAQGFWGKLGFSMTDATLMLSEP